MTDFDEIFLKRIVKRLELKKLKRGQLTLDQFKKVLSDMKSKSKSGRDFSGQKATLLKHIDKYFEAYERTAASVVDTLTELDKLGRAVHVSSSKDSGNKYVRSYSRWSADETHILKQGIEAGLSSREIAKELSRSVDSVSRKVSRLK